MDGQEILLNVGRWLATTGLRILVVIVLTILAVFFIKAVLHKLFGRHSEGKDPEFQKRMDTLASVITHLLTVIIMGIGTITILSQLEVKIGPIIAAGGIVGVALGFGAQYLVRDVINGFFILLDDQIRTGDVVIIADKGGLVEKVSLRCTVLRDLAGNVHFVRNGEIGVVTNMTKDYSRYVFEIGVAYREDIDEVKEVIRQVDAGMRQDADWKDDILEPIEILGLDKFGDSAIIIKARTKTKPIKQWGVAREFNARLKKAFDEKDIEIPFPHTTLYMGQNKTGQAPAMRIQMEKGGSESGNQG